MADTLRPSARVRRLSGVTLVIAALLIALWGLLAAPTAWDVANTMQWLFAIGTVGVGLLLTLKRPENRIGFVVGWMAVGLSSMGTGQSIGLVAVVREEFTNAVPYFKIEDLGFGIFILTSMVLLPLWFPTGRARSKPWAVLSWGGIAVAAGMITSSTLSSSVCVGWDDIGNCIRVEASRWGFIDRQWSEDLGFLLLLLAVPSIAGLVVRFWRASGVEREQLKWFVSAFVALLAGITVSIIFDVNIDTITWPLSLLIPISVAVAVLRYRLYEIDRIISRTVAYALVIALLTAGVALVATFTATQFEDPIVVAATTLAVAALFNPLRKRTQVWVDRRFNRSRYDTQRVIEHFAGSLRDPVDPDGLVDGWVGVVTETMQPEAASVWVREG